MTTRRSLHVVLRNPKPVSVNRLYRTGRGGNKYLSKDGEYFKYALRQTIVRAAMESENMWTETQDLVYIYGYSTRLHIDLYLESIRNKSWSVGGGTTSSGAPRSPFKRIDGTNYIKIIEDAVSEGTGIDDSCNMDVRVQKFESLDDPRVEVRFEVISND